MLLFECAVWSCRCLFYIYNFSNIKAIHRGSRYYLKRYMLQQKGRRWKVHRKKQKKKDNPVTSFFRGRILRIQKWLETRCNNVYYNAFDPSIPSIKLYHHRWKIYTNTHKYTQHVLFALFNIVVSICKMITPTTK